jgi:hypothetical protein
MRRYILFALAAPLVIWAGLSTVGGKRPDDAGTAVWSDKGFVLSSTTHGLLLESIAAGLLAAYLTKGG